MNIWTARIGSILYISTLALLVGVIAHGRAEAQAPGSYECAKEGGQCAFDGTAEVAYGVGTKWAKKVATSSITCGVAGFGIDPAPNQLKTCTITVTTCAREGGRCQFSGVRTVRYGRGDTWAVKTFKDGVTCGVAAFGYDPLENVGKSCFLGPAPVEKPVNEITWLGTHNAIASSYYGISTQNSQRDGVTAQLDRGARALEIDTVYDAPGLGFPAAVYVCHCGKAPHSTSSVEINRVGNGQGNEIKWPFELSGWTHPTPFMRFSTILQEIDRWMLANPGEVVIVLMENNSANYKQLDAEVEAAALKTGIYQKLDDNAWPSKAELVRKNKRLILQVGDDVARKLGYRGQKEQSKYASPKFGAHDVNGVNTELDLVQFGFISHPAYGNLQEYTAAKAKAARDMHQLLIIGAFNSTLTDEITAGLHNSYLFLNYSRGLWEVADAPKPFYPSVIQVNQVHIGDALRLVNDINGPEYLISSKHDNVGTLGDTWQIRFENNAAYNAGILVTYYEDLTAGGITVQVPKFAHSGVVSLATGVARMVNIPRNTSPGKPINVKVYLYSTQDFVLYNEDIPADFTGSPVPCFMATGHLAAPKASRCEAKN